MTEAVEGRAIPLIRVLFVCTGNSARSQIAEALLGRLAGHEFEPMSAGTAPAGVDPDTVRVLGEIGIDWSHAGSRSVAEVADQPFDWVITVCDEAREACPVFPGAAATLHWSLEDPALVQPGPERLAAFRRTRRDVEGRLERFIPQARRHRAEASAAHGAG